MFGFGKLLLASVAITLALCAAQARADTLTSHRSAGEVSDLYGFR